MMKKKYKNKRVLVYGMSISGIWVAKLLNKLKANIFLFDDNFSRLLNVSIKKSTILSKIDADTIKTMDLIIVSPSIEKDNRILQIANKQNVRIMSELEFSSQFCKNIVAVTGTNGKTTTVELITAMLCTQHSAVACGNIGYPVARAVLNNKKAIKVAEVSSFMLENALEFSPYVATVLNIEPDHLIRHKTMEEYQNLKLSIFKNLTTSDYAVFNSDLNITPTQTCKKLTYSYNHIADVRVKDGAIFLKDNKIINLNEMQLKGKHNIYNVMCAICYAHVYSIKPENIRKVLLNFKPNKFRNEFITTINGIKFINDSKSTNIASTLASVEANKGSIILLLGGSNKNLEYTQLFNNLSKRVKQVVAFGEIKDELENANNQKFKFQKFTNLGEAVDFAISQAKENDTILFSPSSASYDQFTNYIERGKFFNEKVKEYELASKKR